MPGTLLSAGRIGGAVFVGGLCLLVFHSLTQLLGLNVAIAAGVIMMIVGIVIVGVTGSAESNSESPPSADDLK
jgi:ABC-type sulfate transport system permease component